MTRVLLLVLDGLPLDRVTPEVMPTLCSLGPVGGTGVLCSSTYPNHATFVTGAHPLEHGIIANWLLQDGRWVQAHEVGPAVPTLFDRCREAGIPTAAVFGDQNLVGVTGAQAADAHWPPGGAPPQGCQVDGSGYPVDEETLPRILEAVTGPARFVMAQLNAGDTLGHECGPGSPQASAAHASYDSSLREVLQTVGDGWVVCVVSDHGQVPGVPGPAVDLWSALPGPHLQVIPEGDAALIIGDDPSAGAWLDGVKGVLDHEAYGPHRIVFSAPGRLFGHGDARMAGVHGGRATLTQVNAVHGAVLPRQGLHGTAWAELISSHLGLP